VNVSAALIDELEDALKDGSNNKRVEVLQKVTDLFVSNAPNFNDEHTSFFDVVLGRLISHIETRATAELSRRLAPIPNAPIETIRQLAQSDDIATAGPVLANSDRLTDDELVEIANTKGQAHLAQIASRSQLAPPVTDAIIERADSKVMHTMVANTGARFSDSGMVKLIIKAEGDDTLTESVGMRSDLTPHLFRQLLRRASDKARQKLLSSAKADERAETQKIIADILAEMQGQATSLDYNAAKRAIRALGANSFQLKTHVRALANEQKLAEVIVALSEIAAVPVELVESLVFDQNLFGTLVLCKAVNLDWLTVFAVIAARPNQNRTVPYRDAEPMYAKMTWSSAQRTLRFWQTRQKISV
jgi:uncharacterized protein (DUF2336 family)